MPRPLPTVAPARLDQDKAATTKSPGSPARRSLSKSIKTPPSSPTRKFQQIRTDWLEDLPPNSPRDGDAKTASERSQPKILPHHPVQRCKAAPTPSSPGLDLIDEDKLLYNFYWTPQPPQTYRDSEFRQQVESRGVPSEVVQGSEIESLQSPSIERQFDATVDDASKQNSKDLLLQSPRSLILSAEENSPAKKLRSSLTELLHRDSAGKARISQTVVTEGEKMAAVVYLRGKEDADKDQTACHTDHEGCGKTDYVIKLERALRAEKRRGEALSRKVALYEVTKRLVQYRYCECLPVAAPIRLHLNHRPCLIRRRRSPFSASA